MLLFVTRKRVVVRELVVAMDGEQGEGDSSCNFYSATPRVLG